MKISLNGQLDVGDIIAVSALMIGLWQAFLRWKTNRKNRKISAHVRIIPVPQGIGSEVQVTLTTNGGINYYIIAARANHLNLDFSINKILNSITPINFTIDPMNNNTLIAMRLEKRVKLKFYLTIAGENKQRKVKCYLSELEPIPFYKKILTFFKSLIYSNCG